MDKQTSPEDEPMIIVFYNVLFSLLCPQAMCSGNHLWINDNNCASMQNLWTSMEVNLAQSATCPWELSCRKYYDKFGMLMSGFNVLMFKHIGLPSISRGTFCYHQRKFHFPMIQKVWNAYQVDFLKQIKQLDGST